MTTLGTRLRQARTEAKLTQEQAAVIAGVSKQAISHIENDRTKNPEAATLEPLSRRLGVSLNWLMTGKGSPRPDSGNSGERRVETVDKPSTRSALASQFLRIDPEILLEAETWSRIFEANDGGGWPDLRRKQKEAEVYALIVADGGRLSAQHHADFLQEMTELARKRSGGGDERGEESAGQPAARRIGGRH